MSAYNVLIEYHWVSKINSTPDIVRTTCIERLWGTMYILHLQSVVGSLMVNLTLCISHVNKNPQTGLQLSYHLDRISCLILINGYSAELFLKQWNHMFFHTSDQKFYIPHHQHIVYYLSSLNNAKNIRKSLFCYNLNCRWYDVIYLQTIT